MSEKCLPLCPNARIKGIEKDKEKIAKGTHHYSNLLSSPIHHHLEAIGWPEYKITMRFWIIGAVSAVAGLIIAIIGQGF